MTNSSQTIGVTPQRQPLLEFRGNEVYGGSAAGLTFWHLATSGYDTPTAQESIVRDFRVWHTYEAAIWNYPVNHLTIDGLVWRIDPSGIVYWEAAIQSGDYRDIDLTIRGGSIHGGGVFGGTEAPLGTIRIENVRAVTRGHAFSFATPETPGTGAGIPDPPGITVIFRNNVVSAWPGQPLRTISMDFQSTPASYPNVRYEVFVYDYQGPVRQQLPRLLARASDQEHRWRPCPLHRYKLAPRNRRHHLSHDGRTTPASTGHHPGRAFRSRRLAVASSGARCNADGRYQPIPGRNIS